MGHGLLRYKYNASEQAHYVWSMLHSNWHLRKTAYVSPVGVGSTDIKFQNATNISSLPYNDQLQQLQLHASNVIWATIQNCSVYFPFYKRVQPIDQIPIKRQYAYRAKQFFALGTYSLHQFAEKASSKLSQIHRV